jgi:hypothetical protein
MRIFFSLVLLVFNLTVQGQKAEANLLERFKKFHQLMVSDRFYIDQYIDDSLSYGHSNGWIENRKDFYINLGSRLIYHSFKEDSIKVAVNKNTGHVRFIADIDVTMDGKRATYHLKVLEVWVKKNKTWKLFARQAVR